MLDGEWIETTKERKKSTAQTGTGDCPLIRTLEDNSLSAGTRLCSRDLGAGLPQGVEGRGVAGVDSGPFVVFSEHKEAGCLVAPPAPNKRNAPDQGWGKQNRAEHLWVQLV